MMILLEFGCLMCQPDSVTPSDVVSFKSTVSMLCSFGCLIFEGFAEGDLGMFGKAN